MYDDPTAPHHLPANLPSTRTICDELSPGLSGLLYREASDDRAKAELADIPMLLSEARRVLPALQRQATLAAGHEGVRRVVGASFARYRQPARSEAEWSSWWEDYYDLLADLPESALIAGMKAWKSIPTAENPQAQFLPSPADLRHLAVSTPNRDARAYSRAKAALERPPEVRIPTTPLADIIGSEPITPRIIRQEPTAAEKAKVRAMFREYADAQDARKAEQPACTMKPTPVPVNEHGVSLAMLELRAKQEGRA